MISIRAIITLTCITLFLTACSSNIPLHQQTPVISQEQRVEQLKNLENWTIKGKVAFIHQNERESANIYWQKTKNAQKLNLTTYLGINVLKLASVDDSHVVEVDDKTYQTQNLSRLIYQLTNKQIPIEALEYWLKGLSYSESDVIEYQNQLPKSLISQFDNKKWQINYAGFKPFQHYYLPTKFTIKQNDFTIKISISQWAVN